jgi:hypothetical protein
LSGTSHFAIPEGQHVRLNSDECNCTGAL